MPNGLTRYNLEYIASPSARVDKPGVNVPNSAREDLGLGKQFRFENLFVQEIGLIEEMRRLGVATGAKWHEAAASYTLRGKLESSQVRRANQAVPPLLRDDPGNL